MMPALYREAAIVAGSFDTESRTFDIMWTAGAEVPRMDWYSGTRYIEQLEVSDKAIRLDRLQSGRAPVLDSHSRWSLDNIMGVVEKNSVKIVNGEGHAKVRMSSREDIAPLVNDIRDGIISNVSPGYITHSYREEMRDGTLYRIATDWEPLEISFVPVGADPDAGRRSAALTYPCRIIRPESEQLDTSVAAAARMRMRQLSIQQ
jgi:hypothetical protein